MQFLILVFSLFLFKTTECCTCKSLPKIDDEQYNRYAFIATGVVTKIVDNKLQRLIYMKVDNLYKGSTAKDTMQIFSDKVGSCGISPEVGENLLMFAYLRDSQLYTDLCTRTKSLNPNALNYNKAEIDDDIAFLTKKQKSSSSMVLPICLLIAGIVGVLWWMRKGKDINTGF